nr:hypothetical protein [Streptomyces atratus]
MPDTFLNALMSCSVTFFSARAPIRCTVEISSSTSVSVISRSRSCSSAASNVTRNVTRSATGCVRRWEGDSTAARARHPATTFGATSMNRSRGRPIARTARSLSISVSIVSRLTLPGASLTFASTGGASSPSVPPPAGPASSWSAPATRATIRSTLSTVSREETRAVSDSSAARRAAPTIRSHRPAVGGSMLSVRQRASSSTRTCSGLRSLCATCSARYVVSFSASATLHSRNPRCSRICARWYSTVRPVQS